MPLTLQESNFPSGPVILVFTVMWHFGTKKIGKQICTMILIFLNKLSALFASFADHKDSVTCTAFSHDSKFVATGDMSGLIIVWDVATKKQVWNFETTDLEVPAEVIMFCISWIGTVM